MRRWGLFVALCGVLFVSVGCYAGYYRTPVIPSAGFLFARLDAPLSISYDETAVATKCGESVSESFLGLIAIGDSSIQTAAKNGKLRKIHYADYRFYNILGLYSKFTTLAYGE